MASIFTKIIQGELPCHKIYEDDLVIAFLTIEPIQPGHTLVVPKIEVDKFYDVDEPHYSEIFKVAKPLSKAIEKVTGCKRVGAMIQGMEVPHTHLHLVPMYDPSDLNFQKAKADSQEELAAMAEKIKSALA